MEKNLIVEEKILKKNKTFSTLITITKKVKRTDKNGEQTTKSLSYKLQFIDDSARFMASLLLNLVDNLAEGIYKIKCKYGHDHKKCRTSGIKYKD